MGGIGGNILSVFGGILWNDNTTGQDLVADTYAKLINATANSGSSRVVVPDYTSSNLTCPLPGVYITAANISIESSVNNVVMHSSLWVNGVESEIESERKISTAGDVGAYSFSGPLVVAAGDTLDVRVKSDKNTTIIVPHAQLWCVLSM